MRRMATSLVVATMALSATARADGTINPVNPGELSVVSQFEIKSKFGRVREFPVCGCEERHIGDGWNKFLLTVDKVLPKKGSTLEMPV